MAGLETIRINKVLKEFNIGLSTLVEFLGKNGIEVQASPNAKISEDAYKMIKKEFAKEVEIKKEAEGVAIKVKDITEKTSPKAGFVEEEPEEDNVFIKTHITSTPKPEPASEPAKPAKVEESVKAVEKKEEAPAPVEKTEVKAPEQKVEAAPQQPKQKQNEAPKQEKKGKEKQDFKILGKIDLDKKPEKKEVKAPEQKSAAPVSNNPAKPQPQKAAQPAATAAPAPQPEEKKEVEHIETKVEKIAGPVITGKIDLSAFNVKKSSQNKENKDSKENKEGHNKDKNSHRKRERIVKGGSEKVDINKNNNNTRDNNNNKPHKKGENGSENANRNHDKKNNKKEKFVKPVHTEIDEDLIQKQIKETYARMTEGKGKTKGSKHRREKRELLSQKMEEERELQQLESNKLKVTEFVTVNELAIMMGNTPVIKVIEACMNLGLMVSINQRLDAEALVLVAEEFGYEVEFVTAESKEDVQEEVDKPEDLQERPPIITVMGHVDHGKTSLLDYIRSSNVIAGEAGGITQHIGAYNVELPSGRKITFLDTPGHEAFTAMRARGAKITDLAIIIIAADDAIMPQTVEAINHAQAAGVPMIFAINKIDKPSAHPERIREQLANMNILVEDWGGKYQCQEISAKQGLNVDKLLDKVLLEADLLELKANPNRNAKGSVIESSLDKGRGYLATVMVQTGTLRVGDIMLSGSFYGKVKAMFNERGQKVSEAGPSTPVSVLGLNGAPTAGELFNVMDEEKEAKDLANKREQLLRIQGLRTQKHITLEEIGRRIAIGNFQELNVIVKGDVDGSIEALSDSLIKLSTEEIHVNVIHKAVGAISESDVLLAAASNAIIIGFQVRPSVNARRLAEKEEIEIRLYSVIYDAINEVKSGIEGMLAPEEKEEIAATAEVRETFKISKVGTIAGCMVKEGKLTRNAKIRVIRDGIVIYSGVLGSLKRFKDDAKEVNAGMDCGLNVEGYNDIKIGDIIEAYQIVEIKRKL